MRILSIQKERLNTSWCVALFFALFFFLLGTSLVSAQDYVPLVGIPNLPPEATRSLPNYLNAVYLLAIGIGSLIAVIKISIAGIKWSMSDIVTDKSSARKDIQGALLGLAILLLPYLVLNEINPNLTSLDVLKNIQSVPTRSPSASGVSGTSGGNQTSVVSYPRGTYIKNCNYDKTCIENCAGDNGSYVYSYNSTACRAECDNIVGGGGQFTDKGTYSTCLYDATDGGAINANNLHECPAGYVWVETASWYTFNGCQKI